MKFEICLIGLAEQGARLQRSDVEVRLEPGVSAAEKSVHDVQARQLRRMKIEFGVPEEERRLTRRFAAMPEHALRIEIHHVAAVQLANAIVAQARPLTNGEGAGFVANQAQRKIQALPVLRITVIGHSHGRLPCGNSRGLGVKNNLTEINHKASLIAKWFRRVIAAVYAVKCTGRLKGFTEAG